MTTTRSNPVRDESALGTILRKDDVLFDDVPYELHIAQSQALVAGEWQDGRQDFGCHLTLTPAQLERLDTGCRFQLRLADGQTFDFYLLDRGGQITPASGLRR